MLKLKHTASSPFSIFAKNNKSKQKYIITRNNTFSDPDDYKANLRAALVTAVSDLTRSYSQKRGKPVRIYVKHSALGTFEIKRQKYALTQLIDELIGDSKYLPNGYITVKIASLMES